MNAQSEKPMNFQLRKTREFIVTRRVRNRWRAYVQSYGMPTHAKDWGATMLTTTPLRDHDGNFVQAPSLEELEQRLSRLPFVEKLIDPKGILAPMQANAKVAKKVIE